METAIRVCRQAGYFEHAVWLAQRYGEHQEYLRIQIEDREDFGDALAYLRRLGTEVAQDNLLRYGKTLLAAEPRRTTELLVDLCCGGLEQKEPEELPSPRQFFAHFVDHADQFITFLETLASRRYSKKVEDLPAPAESTSLPKPSPLRALEFDDAATRDEQAVWNTLLELYVSHGAAADEGEHSQAKLQAKALRLLSARERIPYDETQALLVCSTQGFVEGFILLYEQLGMYDDIVRCEFCPPSPKYRR